MITTEQKKWLKDAKIEIEAKKERIKRLRVISDGRKSLFWDSLRVECEKSAETNERIRDTTLTKDRDEVKDIGFEYAEARARTLAAFAYKGIIRVVEKADEHIDKLNDEIAEINRHIETYSGEKDAPARRHKEVV